MTGVELDQTWAGWQAGAGAHMCYGSGSESCEITLPSLKTAAPTWLSSSTESSWRKMLEEGWWMVVSTQRPLDASWRSSSTSLRAAGAGSGGSINTTRGVRGRGDEWRRSLGRPCRRALPSRQRRAHPPSCPGRSWAAAGEASGQHRSGGQRRRKQARGCRITGLAQHSLQINRLHGPELFDLQAPPHLIQQQDRGVDEQLVPHAHALALAAWRAPDEEVGGGSIARRAACTWPSAKLLATPGAARAVPTVSPPRRLPRGAGNRRQAHPTRRAACGPR